MIGSSHQLCYHGRPQAWQGGTWQLAPSPWKCCKVFWRSVDQLFMHYLHYVLQVGVVRLVFWHVFWGRRVKKVVNFLGGKNCTREKILSPGYAYEFVSIPEKNPCGRPYVLYSFPCTIHRLSAFGRNLYNPHCVIYVGTVAGWADPRPQRSQSSTPLSPMAWWSSAMMNGVRASASGRQPKCSL